MGNIISFVNEILWERNILVWMLIGAGLFFSVKTKFVQLRLFKHMLSLVRENNEEKSQGITSFQAFCISTASRVGAGNLVGVVAAVSIGGAGSIFWMWVMAVIGSASAFAETVLAIIYRGKTKDGKYVGGPAFFLDKGLGKKWLGVLFVMSALICWAGVMQVVSNSVTESFKVAFGIDQLTVTMILIVLTGVVIFGKRDKISMLLSKLVPLMSALYLLVVLFIVIKNINLIPGLMTEIVSQALGIKQAVGGSLGAVIMIGIKRGLFSNEAGSGSAPSAAASADVDHPVKQGLLQALGVFVDTILICSATAFVMLLADIDKTNLTGMEFLQESFRYHVGDWGVIFIALILFLFSFSTVLGIMFYAKNNIMFLSERDIFQNMFKILVLVMLFQGGIQRNLFIWSLADFGIGLMTVINLIGIVLLSKEVKGCLENYEGNLLKKQKMGKTKITI
ncbi:MULTISPECIES: alanine/glycine:cation symporter family protein [Psychrilyobacter]|nr:alanine/glycine:cation symporter family protein [Psychrilyobacter sp. S5]